MFNGTHRIVGAGPADAGGAQYMDIIQSRYFDPSPIRVTVDSFDPVSGAVSVTVTMYSTTYSLVDEDFHIVLFEDDLTALHDHVTRDLYSTPISLTGASNTESFSTTFTIDPSWITANLRVLAFVQLDDQSVLQVGSSDPAPDFKVRAMVPFSRTELGPSSGAYETEYLTVMNIGLTDTFTVDLVVDHAPPGWTTAFKDSIGTIHTDPLAFGLTTDESTTFKAMITPGSPGYMRYHFVVTSTNLPQPLEIPFVYITDDVEALVVDDDGGEPFEDYFTAALDGAGMSYGVWNRGADQLTIEVADTFDVLVWNVGFAFPTLDADDKAFLANYLDSGKALFITGQDVGWDLNVGDPDPAWYQQYLHATWIRDDTNIYELDGVPDDPVTDGLNLNIQGGTGANNQEYPDEIAAADADATEILYYTGGFCGAVRSMDSGSRARVVYLGFGFEAIADAQDRQDLLANALAWIGPEIFTDGFESNDTGAWSNTSP